MSIQHSIKIRLHAEYNKKNIRDILQKGTEKKITYFDHILGERYEESPILKAESATLKVLQASKENIEGGPSVYMQIEETNGFLSFYKSEEGFLEIYFGGFGSPQKKEFKEKIYFIDLDHYIRIALDLCKDFAILKLETESF